MTVPVAFRIEPDELELLDRLVGARRAAGESGVNRSTVIREAIDAYVRPYQEVLIVEALRLKQALEGVEEA